MAEIYNQGDYTLVVSPSEEVDENLPNGEILWDIVTYIAPYSQDESFIDNMTTWTLAVPEDYDMGGTIQNIELVDPDFRLDLTQAFGVKADLKYLGHVDDSYFDITEFYNGNYGSQLSPQYAEESDLDSEAKSMTQASDILIIDSVDFGKLENKER